MKLSKKYSIYLILIILILVLFGLPACLGIAYITIYFIGKVTSIKMWFGIALFIAIFMMLFTIYFFIFIYPLIVKRVNKFTKFLEKHSPSLCLCLLFLTIIVLVVINNKEYSEERLAELINLEWVIYGITIAFFTIWNTFYLSKKQNKYRNPDNLIGIERIDEIKNINTIIDENNGVVFPIVLLILNTIFLLFTTSGFYIVNSNSNITIRFTIITFFFCTNTMISIFLETILPMLKNKYRFEALVEDYSLNMEPQLIKQSITEEVVYQILRDEAKKDGGNASDEMINLIKKAILMARNKKDTVLTKKGENKESEKTKNK